MKHVSTLILFLCFSLTLVAQKPQSFTYETWLNGAWINATKQVYSYDANGYLIKDLAQIWDSPSNSWQDIRQTIYTNNSNGTVQNYITQEWDNISNSWVDSKRETYTYNNLGKPLTIVFEARTNNAWSNASMLTYTYDGNGYLIKSLGETWNVASGSWRNGTQTIYTNNSNGTILNYLTQIWDNSNTWEDALRGAYTYTSSDKPLTLIIEEWINGGWANDRKETNTYDANGNLTMKLLQDWSYSANSWENANQINYTNNGNGEIEQYIVQSWDINSNSWVNTEKGTYAYFSITEIKQANQLIVDFYPNPSKEQLTIKLNEYKRANIKIYDVHGNLIQADLINENKSVINIKNLSPDLYFLYIEQESNYSIVKFIKD